MKICVFGAGAVGGTLAALLAAAGNEVSVVARGANLAAIRRSGITVLQGESRFNARVEASDRPGDLGPQDVVISTLKATALPALAANIGPLLTADTLVVFAQNGMPWWYPLASSSEGMPRPDLSMLDPGGALAQAIPLQSVAASVVYSANTVLEPGVVDNSSPNQNILLVANIRGGDTPRLLRLRHTLENAGIGSPAVADIRQAIWQKLMSNIVTGSSILVETPTSEMLRDAGMRELAKRLVAEVASIASAYGIAVEPRMPNAPAGKKASILHDFERYKPMEIEAQFMAPLAFATAAGVEAPTLQTVAAVIACRASSRGLYFSPEPEARQAVHSRHAAL